MINKRTVEVMSSVPLPKVFILILNWNGWRDTIECLESLQRLEYADFCIVVLDNGSTDGSMGKIKAWAEGELSVESRFFIYNQSVKPVRWIEYDRVAAEAGGLPELEARIEGLFPDRRMVLIQTGANLGYAGGNNVGIRYAMKRGADYIWLLNNDTVVNKDALAEMVKLAEADEHVGMVGSKLLHYNQPDLLQSAGGGRIIPWLGKTTNFGEYTQDDGRWDTVVKLDQIIGASLLVRNETIREIGLLDESFFLYREETDWCERANRSGWVLLYCPKSKIWHKVSKTSGYKSASQDYYFVRNSLILIKKYFPWCIPFALLYYAYRSVLSKLVRFELRRLLFVLKAFMDFLRGKTGEIIWRN